MSKRKSKSKLVKAIAYKVDGLAPLLPDPKQIPLSYHLLEIKDGEPILNGTPLLEYDIDVVREITNLINNKYKEVTYEN